jgi:anti-sigma regulatory factor (Ser/Thr protein kinase)
MPQEAGAWLIFDARMEADPAQVGVLRRAARKSLNDSERAEAVELVVSELLTNALCHGRCPCRLRVWAQSGAVRVEVDDQTPGAAAVVLGPPLADNRGSSGRGLQIVNALADRCGVIDRPPGGKTVWAEIGRSLSVETLSVEGHFAF